MEFSSQLSCKVPLINISRTIFYWLECSIATTATNQDRFFDRVVKWIQHFTEHWVQLTCSGFLIGLEMIDLEFTRALNILLHYTYVHTIASIPEGTPMYYATWMCLWYGREDDSIFSKYWILKYSLGLVCNMTSSSKIAANGRELQKQNQINSHNTLIAVRVCVRRDIGTEKRAAVRHRNIKSHVKYQQTKITVSMTYREPRITNLQPPQDRLTGGNTWPWVFIF